MKMNQLKNVGLVLMGALLVYTTACGDKTKKDGKKGTDTTEPVVVGPKENTMKIGYYNVDSLNEQSFSSSERPIPCSSVVLGFKSAQAKAR